MTFYKIAHLSTLLIASILALPACSTLTPTPQTNAQQAVQTGNYSLDPTHASLTFTISHFGISDYLGQFNDIDGTLDLDEANPEAASMTLTADIASLDVNNDSFAKTLIGPDWFNADAHPQAVFTVSEITRQGGNTGQVNGTLTLNGITQPVNFDVRFLGGLRNPLSRKYTVGFEARGTIKRSDFGITKFLSIAGDKFDFDTVNIHFNGEFQKTN